MKKKIKPLREGIIDAWVVGQSVYTELSAGPRNDEEDAFLVFLDEEKAKAYAEKLNDAHGKRHGSRPYRSRWIRIKRMDRTSTREKKKVKKKGSGS